MYLTSVRIENIKCFEDITLHFKAARKPEDDRQQNWNVILGDNGDGKTTLLRAIAGCLMHSTTAQRVLRPEGWVRQQGKGYGRLTVKLKQEVGDLASDKFTSSRKVLATQYVIVNPGYRVTGFEDTYSKIPETIILNPDFFYVRGGESDLKIDSNLTNLFDQDVTQSYFSLLDTRIFTKEKEKGWISCGYGPFRRVFGISKQAAQINDEMDERFSTLFDEGAALHRCEDWLKEMERLGLKDGKKSRKYKTFIKVKNLLVDLLPDIEEIKLDNNVQFIQNSNSLGLSQLSDGYRSIFALIVDLLRWLEMLRSKKTTPINEVRGLVLIDEVDAHLHPKWQREIGFLLTKTFPNIQFIVTTHSPFVAMAAGKDALTVLQKNENAVIARQDMPYIQDWAVDEVITQIFGEEPYSQKTTDDLSRYEELRFKKRANQLRKEEETEFRQLEADLNQRLEHDPASPKQQAIAEDLEYLKSLLKQKQEQANVAG